MATPSSRSKAKKSPAKKSSASSAKKNRSKGSKASAGSKASGKKGSGGEARCIVVIDGANAFYRAFFAIPNLRAPDGFPTNAAYGFTNMLGKVLREEQPDYVAVAFDPSGGSFRRDIYSEYKANRDAMPEDLSKQIPVVREIVEAFGIPILEVPGFEADDAIATLVESVRGEAQTRVVIVSSDKDLMQLVDERVTLVDGIKDKRIGPAEVEERFGVPPEQILDLRALVGDPSDNIPGVKGIGEKGAAKLIQEWGSLETLLENAGEVKAKRAREALETQAEEARLSKELSTLRVDVELPPLEDLATPEADSERLRELYTRYGFTRLLDSLGGGDGPAAAVAGSEAPEIELEIVDGASALSELAKELDAAERPVWLAVQGEGSSVDAELFGLGVALDGTRARFVPLAAPLAEQPDLLGGDTGPDAVDADSVCDALRSWSEAGPRWTAVDGKAFLSLLGERGLELPPPAADVSLAAFLLDPAANHDLPSVAQRLLGRRIDSWEDLAGRGAKATPVRELDRERLANWVGVHACTAHALVGPLEEALERDGLRPLYEEVELPLVAALSRVERAGVRIDEARLQELSDDYEARLAELEKEIYELAGEEFTVNSPKQLQAVLFDKLKLTPIKKTKTGYSTAEDVLEQLAHEHPLPERVLAWRRLAKLKSTYLDALPPLVSERSGRIHPTFLQNGAATGRLSSTHPNVQNIPIRTEEGIRIREAFVPAEGNVLLSADYSQVELRILAHYSQDESLIDAFQKGEDIHRRTAAEVAGIDPDDVTPDQRARAKAVNFGIIYGSSAFGLANQLGIANSEAQQTIDAYFERYQGVRRFLDDTVKEAKERGFVTTILGRRRYLPDLSSRNRVLRQAAERMAVNTVIQGSEADLIKRAMVCLDEELRAGPLRARMILQVHDELVFDVPKAEIDELGTLARERMSGVAELRVPLEIDVGTGPNWREAH